jgi:hypothetical protein
MNLLKLSYWFHQPFIARGSAVWIWVIIFLGGIFAGLILKFIQQKIGEKYIQKILNSFSNLGLTCGLLGLLWLFMRQMAVPFLAWRFWLLFIIAYAVYVLAKNIKFMIFRLPKIHAEHAAKQMQEKYLPR